MSLGLYAVNEWIIYASQILLLLGAVEIGFRVGKRHSARTDDRAQNQISTFQASSLGLLALLLGFTFSMAASRFELRRDLIVEEANAIGTTMLRAELLPEAARSEVGDLLAEYVHARVDFFDAGVDPTLIAAAERRSVEIQNRLWALATDVAREGVQPVNASLFMQALNETIDLQSTRKAALNYRVPEVIFLVLYIVSFFSFVMVGYGGGLGGKRNAAATTIMALLISSVILLIVDLDRPRRGLFTISQQSLLDLEAVEVGPRNGADFLQKE